jgi:hypothetical protein
LPGRLGKVDLVATGSILDRPLTESVT